MTTLMATNKLLDIIVFFLIVYILTDLLRSVAKDAKLVDDESETLCRYR
jgi:hypothetical protein